MDEGILVDFQIDEDRCVQCQQCLEEGFCFKNLFSLESDNETGKEKIVFNKNNMATCQNCLRCFTKCPQNAIRPVIKEK